VGIVRSEDGQSRDNEGLREQTPASTGLERLDNRGPLAIEVASLWSSITSTVAGSARSTVLAHN